MQVQGIVNPPSNTSAADGSQPITLAGKAGELIDAKLHGDYYTQNYRNNGYIGSTGPAGVVPPIYTSTAQTFGLWNPAGNTKNAVLVALDMNIVSVGTPAVSGLCLSASLNAGSALATGGISAFTAGVFGGTTPTMWGGNIGASGGNTVRFTPSAATTLAATPFLWLPWSYFSTTTGLVGSYPVLHYDFNGGVIVPPNTAVWVQGNISTGSTWNISLRWYEAPL